MKRISTENRRKLKTFMEQQENMVGIVALFSILSYAIIFTITRNVFVLMSGYMICYVCYMKLYKFIYFKLFRKDSK